MKRPMEVLESIADRALAGGAFWDRLEPDTEAVCFPMLAGGEVVGMFGTHDGATLTHDDRKALGAATALVGDWWPIRRLLDRAAARGGIDTPAPSLPDEASVVAVIDVLASVAPAARALAFGGEQLLLQHRALFDLLEARAEARSDY